MASEQSCLVLHATTCSLEPLLLYFLLYNVPTANQHLPTSRRFVIVSLGRMRPVTLLFFLHTIKSIYVSVRPLSENQWKYVSRNNRIRRAQLAEWEMTNPNLCWLVIWMAHREKLIVT